MGSEQDIRRDIEIILRKVILSGDYSLWTIGVTDDPARRRAEHGDPPKWQHWEADTKTTAINIERYFLEKGMESAGGGPGSSDYVYIF